MDLFNQWAQAFNNFVWGNAMLCLLVGGGLFFTLYSRLQPFRYLRHAFALLAGRYDDADAKGSISHRQALSTALAGTVGMGNIAGVALAITAGGPGAVFWMWVSALLGVSTKFFTCSLGVMYRHQSEDGRVFGGPMYVVLQGLGQRWKPLALLFATAGLFGTMPAFQANQLTAVVREELLPNFAVVSSPLVNWSMALLLSIVVGAILYGGLSRVAKVASKLVPSMALMYMFMTVWVLIQHWTELPDIFTTIFSEAFNPKAVSGGLLGVMLIGISRGVFSNEAGIGTEVMAHGAAKTDHPIREGLVGMLGPIIDTLLICTCTALVILASGVWQHSEGMQGVELTMGVYRNELGLVGQILLTVQVLLLASTTMFTYGYYGERCFAFLFGEGSAKHYKYFYIAMIAVGCTFTLDFVFNVMMGMYALMAIPTMLSALLLAPKVMQAAKTYFASIEV